MKKKISKVMEEFYKRIEREQGIVIDKTKTESFNVTKEDLIKTGLFVFEDEMYSERLKKDENKKDDT